MKPKSLPKNFIRTKEIPYFYNEKYISNGKFIMPKSLVKDCFKYCIPDELATRVDIDRVRVEKENLKYKYMKTNKLFDVGEWYMREFYCITEGVEEENKKAYINEDYVKFFEIEEIEGTAFDHQFLVVDKDITLMPCRPPKEVIYESKG